jgi:hypothetical protein
VRRFPVVRAAVPGWAPVWLGESFGMPVRAPVGFDVGAGGAGLCAGFAKSFSVFSFMIP